MIRTKELRIGNYVIIEFRNRDEIQRVYKLEEYPHEGYVNKNGIENVKPILITEEILLKCGFRKVVEDADEEFFTNGDVTLFNYCRDNPNNWIIGNNILSVSRDNLQLHQLQNLYFELFGKELEIKI